MLRRPGALLAAGAAAAVLAGAVLLSGRGDAGEGRTGNVVLLHPDGTGLNDWNAARMYWYGPDAVSPWDTLPHTAVYRGLASDAVAPTSNAAATAHAFGYRVRSQGSFGRDGRGDDARPIASLSGYPGSVMREAANAGHPVGIVNDGTVAEPGTGAFLAEVADREDENTVMAQILGGRTPDDTAPWVVMGGGEGSMIPAGVEGAHCPAGRARGRTDGRDLLAEARAGGYLVVRTRRELAALEEELARRPGHAPRVLGVFACGSLFNDTDEEELREDGFVDPSVPDGDRRGDLVLFGQPPLPDDAEGAWAERRRNGQDPPTVAEMTRVALEILGRAARREGRGFLLVSEAESNDDFANANNAIGVLTALRHANETIAVVRDHIAREPRTLLLTAADSDSGGMQVIPQDEGEPVGAVAVNRAEGLPAAENPLDGIGGRGTTAFSTAEDAAGETHGFGIAWAADRDAAGAVLVRADGLNADLLATAFAGRMDAGDVYRLMYRTLFGAMPAHPGGGAAPTR